jgi:cation diffusion facilitator family transporter
VATIPLKEILFRLTRMVGRREHNPAVLANAWHHRTDAMSSLAATAGLAGAMFAGSEWRMLDGITAAVISAFLLVTAGKLILSGAGELVDRAPDAKQTDRIAAVVAETAGVRSFHAFRARRLGGKVEMDLHVQVDPHLTVAQGHDIAGLVRRRILDVDRTVQEVIVHVEPAK